MKRAEAAFALILHRSRWWSWVLHLGGPGLIVVGLIDNSVIPIPGSMDVFVILLSAHHREGWIYYALMATAGAVLGGFATYGLAKEGGKEGLERRVGKQRAEKVYNKFEKEGFSTVLVSSILPPPFPMVSVLMAAGILQYSRKKFLSALAIGRATRFFALAFLGHVYGTVIIGWLTRYSKPSLYVLIALAVLGTLGAVLYFKWHKPKHQAASQDTPKRRKAA